MQTNRKRILPILGLFLIIAISIVLGGNTKVLAGNVKTFENFSIAERYANGDGGLQPAKQGTDYGTGNTRWEVKGFSLIYGGTTTIMGDNQSGFFNNTTEDLRRFSTTPTINILAGNERVYESSIYTKIAGSSTYQYHNIRFRINPAAFKASSVVHGRSLLDNLLLEVAAGGARTALAQKIAPGGTGWLNAIMSAKSSSTSAHTIVNVGKLYKDGSSSYSYPIRTFLTYAGWANSGSWPASSTGTVSLYFEIRLNLPVIQEMDETAPTISLSPMSNSAYVYTQNVTISAADTGGSGLSSIYYQTRFNGGAWSGATYVSNGANIALGGTGYYEIWGVATDGNGNQKTVHGYHYYVDRTAPSVNASALYGQQYKNGNDYWFAPNVGFTFDNTGYDGHSQIANQYIRLAGSADIRAHHSWNAGATYFDHWVQHPSVVLTGVSRISNSGGYRRLQWTGTTKSYDYDFDVQYYYGDNAGNVVGYNNTGMRLRIDASAPSIPSISVSPSGWTAGNASVTIGHGADSRSGVNRSIYRINSGAWVNYSGAISITAVGTTKIEAITVDNVGHWSGIKTAYVYIDRTAPSGTTSISPSAWTNGNVTISLTTGDTGGSGYYRTLLPNGTYSTSTAPTHVVTTNGTYSFTVYDHAGNSTILTRTVSNIDKTAPGGAISISPSGPTNGNVTVTLSATDTGGSGYYRTLLPNGTYSTSATPTHVMSANGTASFTVYDNAGNSKVVSHAVSNIDKTAPTATTSISPSAWTKGNVTITVATSDTGGSGYYRTLLPGGTYSTSTSPTHVVTVNGTYSFTVYDNAGNSKTVSQVVSNIDKTVPTISMTQNPTSWTNGAVDITVTASDGQSGLSDITPNSQSAYAGMNLLEGSDATTEYASLAASNREYLRTKWDFAPILNTHGLVPYTLSFDMKVPVNGTVTAYMQNGSGARYSFSNPISATTSWKRYSVTFTPSLANSSIVESFLAFYGTYSTGRIPTIRGVKLELGTEATAFTVHPNDEVLVGNTKVYTVTNNGTYTYRATDKVGNTSISSITINNIDRVDPTGITSISPSTWTNGNVTITLSAADAGGSGYYRTLLPNGTYSTSATPTHVVTANGTYSFTVYDNAGNSTVVTRTVSNIDRTVPGGTTTISPATWTNGNVIITLSATDIGGSGFYRTLLPNGTYSTSAVSTYAVSSNGTYNFTIYDNAGNSTVVTQIVSNIDKTAPTGTTSISPSTWTNGSVTISVSVNDAGGSGYYRTLLPNGTYSTSAVSTYVVASNGTYSFTIYDNSGNSTVVNQVVSNIDKTAPTGTTSISPSAWTNGNVTITVSASDIGGSGFYRIQNPDGTYVNATTTTYVVSANGTYNFVLFDNVGNTKTISQLVSNIEKIAPTATTSISPATWTSGNVTITLSTNDTGGSGYYRTLLPDGTYSASTSPTYVATTNGAYTFKVYDNAGNSSVITLVTSNIDRTAPTAPTINPDRTDWGKTNITFTLTHGTDSQSGVSTSQYRIDGGAWTTYSTTVTISKAGISTVEARTIDKVGNISTVSTKNVYKDITAPVVSANPSSSDWVDDKVTVALTFTDTDSGIAVQQYAWSLSTTTPAPGDWIAYTAPISQSAQGIWYLHYKAVDNAENETIGNFGVYKVKKETNLKVSNIRATPKTVVLTKGQASTTRKMTVTFTVSNILFPNHGKPINPVVTIKYGTDTVNTTLWKDTVQMPANGSSTKTVDINSVTLSPGKSIIVEVNGIEAGYMRFDEYNYSGMNPYLDNKAMKIILVSEPLATYCKIITTVPTTNSNFVSDSIVRNNNTWTEQWTKTTQKAVVVPPYFNVTSRVTETEVKSYSESYKIMSLKFRSKYTVDNQHLMRSDPSFTGIVDSDGWQTIKDSATLSTTKQREDNIAKIKAGYGFEVIVETKYITDRYIAPVGYIESFSDLVYSATYGNGYANYTTVSPSITPVKSPTLLYFNMYDSAGRNRYCQEIPIVNSQGPWYDRTDTFERTVISSDKIWTVETLYGTYNVNIKTPNGSGIENKFMGYEEETPVGSLGNKTYLYDTFNFELQILGQDDIKSHYGN